MWLWCGFENDAKNLFLFVFIRGLGPSPSLRSYTKTTIAPPYFIHRVLPRIPVKGGFQGVAHRDFRLQAFLWALDPSAPFGWPPGIRWEGAKVIPVSVGPALPPPFIQH